MSVTTQWTSSHQTIDRQHKQLQALVVALQSRFSAGQPVSRSLVSLLNAMAAHLQMHFEFEEADDYFPSLIRHSPALANEIERLIREHRELLEEVSQLVDHARSALMKQQHSRDLQSEFEKLCEKLNQHETLEKKVLQDAYCLDIGTKD